VAETLFKVDLNKPMQDQEVPGHNRWHPDIPAAASTDPGTDFRMECLDWTNNQVKNDDSADDIRDIDLTPCHVLSGPIHVNGAEPGDLLVVDILDLGTPKELDEPWGYTGIFSQQNGGGFLTDVYPDAHKAIWDLRGLYASSRHIPDVQFVGIKHPGLIGCAPSADLLAKWNQREQALIDTDPDRVPPLALPPLPQNALLGTLTGSEFERAAGEAARTIPPREHGGNCDIKNLTVGSRIYFPVYVDGAKLSLGDLHFSQGDGEITFCGAIEMAGYIDLGVELIKGGMEKYGMTRPMHMPIFEMSHLEPRYSSNLVFEGIGVEDDGTQRYLSITAAYRQACLNAIEYLKKFGYTDEQAYIILGTAPIEGRVAGVVDIPNAAVSIYIPTEIFKRNILPTEVPARTRSDAQLPRSPGEPDINETHVQWGTGQA
jgi:formamidase